MSLGTDNRSASTDETVAGLDSAEVAQTDHGQTPGFHAGQVLEQRYRLVTRIGRGAMGEVWEAQHVAIGRRVAIKLIAPNAAHADLATRLQREAEYVARLEHPNIVTVTDFGLVEAGAPFVVMERLSGRTLAELIVERGHLDGATAREILGQLTAGLAHAHAAGIVHRDLKPSNVFVLDDATGAVRVKIIDFGIAKATAIDPSDRALTRVGAVFGTPAYMAPEQIRGEPLDARVDLYALGGILYEMLVGEPPWRRRTSVELMYCHLFEPTPSVRLRVPDAPADLDALVMWCMAKDRTLRPADADALRLALIDHRIERGATVVPHEPPPIPSAELRARYATDVPVPVPVSSPLPSASPPRVAPRDRPAPARARATWWIIGGAAIAVLVGAGVLAMNHRRHRAAAAAPATGEMAKDAAPTIAPASDAPTIAPASDAPTNDAPIVTDTPVLPTPTQQAVPESPPAAVPGDGTVMRDVPPPKRRSGGRTRGGDRRRPAPDDPLADIREPFSSTKPRPPQRKDETYQWPED